MNPRPPNLSQEPWLADGPIRQIFAALTANGGEARVVGGAVRNALLGIPVVDIDIATTVTPEDVAKLAAAAHIKVVPTGIEHGTLTLVCHGQPFQVTTLREDIASDGRHAVVRFGQDWEADAQRRDFTVNALSVGPDGVIHDPVGGYEDVRAGRIRFIGSPAKRIAEDRLRILRFFRFNAEHGRGPVDDAGLTATTVARQSMRSLSAERIGQEMRRLLVAPRAVEMARLMQEIGILPIVFAGIGYVATLERLVVFEAATATEPSFPLRLAALACRIAEDVDRVAIRLRLTNAERDRLVAALGAARGLSRGPGVKEARALLYRHGRAAYADGVALAAAWSNGPPDDAAWRALAALPAEWTTPTFPLSGRDVIGQGAAPGAGVGDALRAVEAWWIEHDFVPDEAALRRQLAAVVAAAR